jgi:ribulose kinase
MRECGLALRQVMIDREYVMKNVSVFGSALALAVALGAFPLTSANADKAAEEAAKAVYEEAKQNCEGMSSQEAKVQCYQQADQDYKVALQEAMKK